MSRFLNVTITAQSQVSFVVTVLVHRYNTSKRRSSLHLSGRRIGVSLVASCDREDAYARHVTSSRELPETNPFKSGW